MASWRTPSTLALTDADVLSVSEMRAVIVSSVALDQLVVQSAPMNCGSITLVRKSPICVASTVLAAGSV